MKKIRKEGKLLSYVIILYLLSYVLPAFKLGGSPGYGYLATVVSFFYLIFWLEGGRKLEFVEFEYGLACFFGLAANILFILIYAACILQLIIKPSKHFFLVSTKYAKLPFFCAIGSTFFLLIGDLKFQPLIGHFVWLASFAMIYVACRQLEKERMPNNKVMPSNKRMMLKKLHEQLISLKNVEIKQRRIPSHQKKSADCDDTDTYFSQGTSSVQITISNFIKKIRDFKSYTIHIRIYQLFFLVLIIVGISLSIYLNFFKEEVITVINKIGSSINHHPNKSKTLDGLPINISSRNEINKTVGFSGYEGFVQERLPNYQYGNFISGAKITFVHENEKLIYTTTSIDGQYKIKLIPGRYKITVKHPDYETYTNGSGFYVYRGGLQIGNIFMEPKKGKLNDQSQIEIQGQ